MKITRSFLTFTFAVAILSLTADAALILNLDTNAKTFKFSGSATGSLTDHRGGGRLGWRTTDLGVGLPNSIINFNNDIAWSSTVGDPGLVGFDTSLASNPGLNGNFEVILHNTVSGAQTISGNNSFQSYSSLDASAQAAFESLIGTTMPTITETGTVFPGLIVRGVSSVPEPSALVIFAIGCIVMFLQCSSRSK